MKLPKPSKTDDDISRMIANQPLTEAARAEIEAYPDITTLFLLTGDKPLFKQLIDAGYRSLSLTYEPAARTLLDNLITDLQQQLSYEPEE
jgi:hypothetical protein